MKSYTIQFGVKIQTITFFELSSEYQQREKNNPIFHMGNGTISITFFHEKKSRSSIILFFAFTRFTFFILYRPNLYFNQYTGNQKVLIFATFLLDFSNSQGSTERFFSDKYQIRDHTSFAFAIIISTRLANFVLHLGRCDETLQKRMKNGKTESQDSLRQHKPAKEKRTLLSVSSTD